MTFWLGKKADLDGRGVKVVEEWGRQGGGDILIG
jgi:hypothetical protein